MLAKLDIGKFFELEAITDIAQRQHKLAAMLRKNKDVLIAVEAFFSSNEKDTALLLSESRMLPLRLQEVVTKYYTQELREKKRDQRRC